MSPGTWIVVIVVAYMTALLVLGAVASRFARSPEQYWLAGRSMGSWVTAISSTASSESGWVVLGAVGMAYVDGLSALWFAPGCLLGYAVNLYWLAPRLRRAAADQGSLTLLDLIADRLGGPVRTVRIVGAVVILCCLGGYVAAQMTATGKAMEAILGLPYARGVVVGGGIIVIYTLLGGFRAVAWTDFLQGLVMVGSLVIMPILVVAGVGGYGALFDRLQAIHPALVEPTGNLTGALLFGSVTGLLGIGLGYPGQPHVLTRYMAASSDEKIRQTQLIAMTWGVLVFYGAGFLGLAGRVLLPELMVEGDPEQLFPLLARQLLPPVVAGIMLAAILSAVMSTVSSQLLVAASTVSRDVMERILGLGRSHRTLVASGRIAVLVLGIVAILVAMQEVRLVFWFVLYAWSGLGAAFGPVLLLALTTRRVTGWGAVAGMATGFLVTVVWKQTGLSTTIIYELVPAFLAAGLATLAGSSLDRSRRPARG
ncbi:MAG: sodium/proline symporter [Deltaproteobacteria bacterium]|nr:sodium/proline symporter [Deltaproteobacteria bacterium]